jgi:phosphatidylserine decarboxylase
MNGDYPHPIIAREAWPFIAIAAAVAIALSYFGWWFFAILAWLAVVFVVQFFRDPPRAARTGQARCSRPPTAR